MLRSLSLASIASVAPVALAAFALVSTAAVAKDKKPAKPADAAPAGDAAAQPGDAPTQIDQAMLDQILKAQKEQDEFNKQIGLKNGPLDGDMSIAQAKIVEGEVFTDGSGAKAWSRLTHNPVSEKEIGLVGLKSGSMIYFEYDDIGYVKDDDKDDLDADELLKSIKEGTDADNARRQAAGEPPLNVLGWEQKPTYNAASHTLEWCIKAESGGVPSYNFNTRVLGRRGVVLVTLMFGGDVTLQQALPEFRDFMSRMSFKTGETYSEYKSGDKLAEYGLGALVAGGGVALAAKTGLLSKLGLLIAKGGKVIFVGIVAVVGAIGKFFQKLFGKNNP